MNMNLRLQQIVLLKPFRKYWFAFSILVVGSIYICFPNHNPMFDSLAYGGNVKYGNDLFSAHHLLYEYFNYLIFKTVCVIFPATDALHLMQFVNAMFALLCLQLVYKIIKQQTSDNEKSKFWTFFIATTFGFMRFSVEAEVYIIPIFFSLFSSLYFLKYLKTSKASNVFIAGFFASVACLFHQIHLFWGIGLFIGLLCTSKVKPLFYYLISTPIVLFSYIMVLVYYNDIEFTVSNLYQFMAQYYYTEGAEVGIGLSNLLITSITFFRTFFQVHGIVMDLLKMNSYLYALIPLVLCLLIYSIVLFVKSVRVLKRNFHNANFEKTHLIIFMLQFGFAFFSNGNSEFMVMLPIVMALFIPYFIDFNLRSLLGFSISMLIWNFSFCIYPNNQFNFMNNKMLSTVIHENPTKIFVLKEGDFVCNQYYYIYGYSPKNHVFEADDEIILTELDNKLVLTDILTKRIPYNRNSYLGAFDNKSNLVFVKHEQFIDSSLGGYFVDVALMRR